MKYTIVLLITIIWLPLIAQYNGGYGDGHSRALSQTTIAGESVSIFTGGHGDGADRTQVSTLVTSEMLTMYRGGSGDGQDKALVASTLSEFCDLVSQIDGDPIITGVYRAGQQILSSGKVRSDYNVVFQSGNNIILQADFLVENNAVFEMLIEACMSTPINH